MENYAIPLVPGPTFVPMRVREVYLNDFGSADLEPEYVQLYVDTQHKLQQILKTENEVAIMTGEGMLALWGALKSALLPGDRVLAVATGVFGEGIGAMARQVGADVQMVSFPYDQAADPNMVEDALRQYRPKMITAVHCETPSGTLNPIEAIGELVAIYDVPLFYVDAVSSAGGALLNVDDWHIDLCLVGSQKCLSAPPNTAMVAVSARAWDHISEVAYAGYDALAPWRTVVEERWFPYTPSWHDTAALNVACQIVLDEGIDRAVLRHDTVAAHCRRRLREMGMELFPTQDEYSSPTVTAVKVPDGMEWPELDQRLRRAGMGVAGSIGPLDGKVFRIGHMGSQADQRLVDRGLDVLAGALGG